jgi:hypothetical protein
VSVCVCVCLCVVAALTVACEEVVEEDFQKETGRSLFATVPIKDRSYKQNILLLLLLYLLIALLRTFVSS